MKKLILFFTILLITAISYSQDTTHINEYARLYNQLDEQRKVCIDKDQYIKITSQQDLLLFLIDEEKKKR